MSAALLSSESSPVETLPACFDAPVTFISCTVPGADFCYVTQKFDDPDRIDAQMLIDLVDEGLVSVADVSSVFGQSCPVFWPDEVPF